MSATAVITRYPKSVLTLLVLVTAVAMALAQRVRFENAIGSLRTIRPSLRTTSLRNILLQTKSSFSRLTATFSARARSH